MMIKQTIRYASYFLALVGVGTQSCSSSKEEKPDCYKCTYDGYSETYCFSYYKEEYGWTREEFEDFIDYLRSDGYKCKTVAD